MSIEELEGHIKAVSKVINILPLFTLSFDLENYFEEIDVDHCVCINPAIEYGCAKHYFIVHVLWEEEETYSGIDQYKYGLGVPLKMIIEYIKETGNTITPTVFRELNEKFGEYLDMEDYDKYVY